MESTIVADEKSTHKIEIFTLTNLEKHPNADTLSITKIADTEYTYVAKTEDWQNHLGKPVAWIPPDSLINPMTKGCEFLAGERRYDKDSNKISDGKYVRIKAKKIRNIVSYGLLIPLNDESEVSALDIQHYEPPFNMTSGKTGVKWISGEVASPPEGNFPKYDVDAFMKYAKKVFIDGELVNVTEKIHGANSRFLNKNSVVYCGSRTEWKKEFPSPPKITVEELINGGKTKEEAELIYNKVVTNFKPSQNMWWKVYRESPQLQAFLANNDGFAVYGEVYGQVQNLKYGTKPGEILFAAFDILHPNGNWLDVEQFSEMCEKYSLPRVPIIRYNMPFDFEQLVNMASGNTLIAAAGKQIREGIVVKPMKERWHPALGRVCLKIVSPEYLEMK